MLTAEPGALPLAHPLPAGMRDLLPEPARERSELVRRVMRAFALAGYEQVVLPAFEHARVLERGLGSLDPDEVLQFVEPETGEIVALCPDMTPQVARLLVTRLAELPLPARIAVEGSVLRRRRVRARRHRQIPQAGIELLGVPAGRGDLEVIEVAVMAAECAGLERFVIDLGHVGVASSLLHGIEGESRRELVQALALKDAAAAVRRAERAGLRGRMLAALAELPVLEGGAELWPRAERVLDGTPALSSLRELRRLWDALDARGVGRSRRVDLGEISNFDYYTGTTFQLLAEGPGESIGSGGRYDDLLGRFGLPRPAAGCAFDLDNLRWALDTAGLRERRARRVLVAVAEMGQALVDGLRRRGVAAALAEGPAGPNGRDPAEYARAWRYSHLLRDNPDGATLADLVYGTERALPELRPEDSAALVAALVDTWSEEAARDGR